MPSYINSGCWLQDSTTWKVPPSLLAMGKSHCIILISAWRPTNDSKTLGYKVPTLYCLSQGKQSHTCLPALSRLLASWASHGTSCPAVVIIP